MVDGMTRVYQEVLKSKTNSWSCSSL